MLKRLSAAEQIGILLDQYSVAVRNAFLAVIADIKSRIALQPVIDRLTQHDIAGAIRVLSIEAPAFNPVLDEIAKAFTGGGNGAIDALPALRSPDGVRLVLRFDARNPVAEAWLKAQSSTFVTNVVADQVAALRDAMADGLSRLQSPRSIALDIVGRKSAVTGQREGGIVGLTAQQAGYVRNYRAELEAGDKAALDRALRDRGFDKNLASMFEAGKTPDAATISKLVTGYESRMLQLRGETVARTETISALGASSEEAMRQNIANGYISADLVDQKWNTILDGRERDSHAAMDGQVVGWGQSFTSGAGYRLRYPGDTLAPVSEIANCRCNRTFSIRKSVVLH